MKNAFFRTVILFSALAATVGATAAQDVPALSVVYVECTYDGATRSGTGIVIDDEGRFLTAKHVLHHDDATCKGVRGTAATDPTRNLTRVHTSDRFDMAVLKFTPHPEEEFEGVPFFRLVAGMEEVETVVAHGFPESGNGAMARATGTLQSVELDADGLVGTDVLTAEGWSGGPVAINGTLIGIVAGAELSQTYAIPTSYRVVAVEAFENEIQSYLTRLEWNDVPPEQSLNDIISSELASDDPCTTQFRRRVSVLHPDVADEDWNLVPSPASELSAQAEFWVTINTGPARWINCRGGTESKLIYFPMGLMLRPEYDVTIDGTTRVVFQTEYGLRVIIDHEAVAPIDAGFVFARGVGVFKLCTNLDSGCDPGEELPILGVTTDRWPYLAGYLSYLRTEDVEDLDYAHKELQELSKSQNAVEGHIDPFLIRRNPQTLDEDPACQVRKAKFYAYSTKHDPEVEREGAQYPRPLHYSLCTKAPDGVIRSRATKIKAVTPTIAADTFRELFAVSALRNPPDNMINVAKALSDSDRTIVRTTDCGEETDAYGSLGNPKAIEVFTNAPLNRNQPLDLNQAVMDEREERKSDFANYPEQLHFRNFQTHVGLSSRDIIKQAPLFNDVVLNVKCVTDRGELRVWEAIVDLSPIFHSDPIVIDLWSVHEAYVKNGRGLRAREQRRVDLSNGVIDVICEFMEYATWQQVLYDHVKDLQKTKDAADTVGVSRGIMVEYLTHLMLAMFYSTDVELRELGQPETCAM